MLAINTGTAPPVCRSRPVRVLTPAPRDSWRHLLAEDRTALTEQCPEWVDAICATGPYSDASRHYEFADGRCFVLPMVRRRGLAGALGWSLSYPPAWGIGGLVGADLDRHVVAGVLNDLRDTGTHRIWIRPNPLHAELWRRGSSEYADPLPLRAHVLDLTGGTNAVYRRIHAGTRKYIRRAERAGVRIEIDRSGALLDSYYRLYTMSVDRWAGRQHEPRALARWRAARRDPLAKLRAMASHLDDSFVLAMAYVDGQPAFGSIMLLGNTAHVTRSAMDIDRVGSTKAGSLVHWTLVQLAIAHGCTSYHLGESGQSASLAQFKEGLGAEPIDYAEYRLERLPISKLDKAARTLVKQIVGFRDT